MKFSELLEECVGCIKTFNPIINTLDSHADDFLAKWTNDFERVFVKQVFYGCVRYQDFLKIFTKVLYERNTQGTNRNDATLYTILTYVTLFRLDELAIEDYKKLIYSQDAVKMHVFLQFIFDADKLRDFVREEWMTLYDFSYIDDKIIGGIEKNLPSVAEILGTVEKKATGKMISNLTQSSFSAAAASEGQEGTSKLAKIQEEENVKKEPTK